MALIQCKECGNDMSKKASVCPHCGYKRISRSNKVFNTLGTIAKIFIFTVFSILALKFCVFDNTSTPSTADYNKSYLISQVDKCYKIAQKHVLLELKAPSTAKFPRLRDIKYKDNENGTYVIDAYVDSQNSFGANIRTNFRCTINPYKTTECEDLVFY